eukprot:6483742-Amphidinium_carterae.2
MVSKAPTESWHGRVELQELQEDHEQAMPVCRTWIVGGVPHPATNGGQTSACTLTATSDEAMLGLDSK